jgi:nucleotide-binding universal stress UspA family protein
MALALGESTNSKVLVLAVARPSEPGTSAKAAARLNGAREQLERMLSQLRDRVQRNGIKIETQVAAGHPAEEIISKAREDHADLIIVGHRGTSSLDQLTLGSVSEQVLSHAPCPVMVTRWADDRDSRSFECISLLAASEDERGTKDK